MARPVVWRVRVKRATESWVDVLAHDGEQAEAEAMKVPGVMQVFARSAMRGDEAAIPERPEGVRED